MIEQRGNLDILNEVSGGVHRAKVVCLPYLMNWVKVHMTSA